MVTVTVGAALGEGGMGLDGFVDGRLGLAGDGGDMGAVGFVDGSSTAVGMLAAGTGAGVGATDSVTTGAGSTGGGVTGSTATGAGSAGGGAGGSATSGAGVVGTIPYSLIMYSAVIASTVLEWLRTG